LLSCGKDKDADDEVGAIGSTCTPGEANACQSGLECSPTAVEGQGRCVYPIGSTCEPENQELLLGGCADSAVCAEIEGDETTTDAASSAASTAVCKIALGELCDPSHDQCAPNLRCASIVNGENRCFGAVILRGTVADTTSSAAITNAHIIALDDEGAAVTDVAVSSAQGTYKVEIPVDRNVDGTPVADNFTLSASAQDFQAFPSGIRVALPINAQESIVDGERYIIDNALTAIGLIPLPAGARFSIDGGIAPLPAAVAGTLSGVLIVANEASGSHTAISDKSGSFTIFNVPAGTFDIRGYAANLQLEKTSATLSNAAVSGVVLPQIADATTTVSGNIQIVNAPGGALTSVILVVEETFDETVARGELPRGLRAPRTGIPNVDGNFTIEGVPEGRYVALAAYENDDLVRDPDANIGGTGFVHLTVERGVATLTLSDSFKVTEALAIQSPGANGPESVAAAPTLRWADDSSEDWYDLRVFDAFGVEVWNRLNFVAPKGESIVSVPYEGPLVAGMYYQFRVSSWRQPGGGTPSAISMTEDLRGVFYAPVLTSGKADGATYKAVRNTRVALFD
jgi:hypothetical protein